MAGLLKMPAKGGEIKPEDPGTLSARQSVSVLTERRCCMFAADLKDVAAASVLLQCLQAGVWTAKRLMFMCVCCLMARALAGKEAGNSTVTLC